MTFMLDGTSYSAPQSFIWTAGSEHSVSWNSPQGKTYVFDAWSDGVRQNSRTLTAPISDTALNGNFVQGSPSLAVMLTPSPGGPLSSASPFTWSAASNATQYLLEVGSSPGGHDLFSQATSATSLPVPNLPAGNTPVYVRLSSLVGGVYFPQSL